MSTPYERLIKPVPQRSREHEKPPQQPAVTTATVAKKMMRRPVRIEKPQLPFSVRPRFRFEVPPPPMDPKMLLGTLSTAAYAKPHFSDMERDFRPNAIPLDPTHGLRANLVDTQLYKAPAKLEPDDIVLLNKIMKGRSGGEPLNARNATRDKMRDPGMPPPPRKPEPTNVPWMRRMAYDEYDTTTAHKNMHAVELAAKLHEIKRQKEARSEKSRRERLLKSFKPPSRNMKHPGRKLGNVRPINAAPIYPDVLNLMRELIAIEVDKDECLTVPKRVKNDPEAADQSILTTATVSVAERRTNQREKKFVACYTPTLKSVHKRKRVKEEEGDDDQNSKKIYFGDKEDYQWVGEYAIREGVFEDQRVTGIPGRSCIGITEHVTAGGKARVVTASRIGTTWKLSRRAQSTSARLGKNGLRIMNDEQDDLNEEVLESLLSGENTKRRRTKSEPKREPR